jgi:DGQHR domain-containing protein
VFPNAIVLATDRGAFELGNGTLQVPSTIKLLVVDGQHRLWAQKFSEFPASYACIIHTGLSEIDMARLFLEINDNQKRVPSSLRWDLVRLVRPEDDPVTVAAADMVYQLATDEESPLFQRIDLTGEQSEIQLKQGSIAPELRKLLGKRSPLGKYSFEQQYAVLAQYFFAIKEVDREGWRSGESSFLEARVLRALLRLLSDIAKGRTVDQLTAPSFLPFLSKIDAASLKPELIRAVQASAGVKAIYDQIKGQVFQGA